ncbi:MAG: aminotransferase class I/II-fold pyridoxal phosphate-dependent enzyme [Snodgrassella sp.]|jgi:methionine transaminase|uniref:methionine aminotransferase n=1 Tax=Snodgrassella TaxID=1193515 RepID=UPI0008161428|nr:MULTISPECIES: methionine aminotransferase [Snodgrassella]MCO6507882.1 aminotransferase class I/II-fold pyridoxal phosphate-dependent enzyme [Snodgrassella sp.]MCO6518024.1 aminotransferase class I/II-fold pyridoxal phosphate-dependent enzyme [Snodgrassella sp.]MCO6522996.1 aminotransferase class I/II-fold pyridoxal phosphate-dependent enzyme [Snodgrassella sp.]PIT21308.1 methionine aminotransferase [Snodgrassella communis]SCC05155.1 methionine aminotransferase [Snodgrassella sp. R-53583]
MLTLDSKLPAVGTTIFSVMSALAAEHGALNLSQGFPDYAVDPKLIGLVERYLGAGTNQYAPMTGVAVLRERIQEKFQRVHGLLVDAEQEITVTAGGTEAIFTTIAALIRPGDEVISFEPAYDCYAPAVTLFGGTMRPVRLVAPEFAVDWDYVKSLITPRTRLIIVNNPNNPACRVFSMADIAALAEVVQNHNIFVLSDEVYEHLVFDDIQPQTLLRHPLLRERTFVVGSFGKLLHATGWKVGYCVAAPALMAEFRKVHQFNVFSVHTPTQYAIADYLADASHYENLGRFFQQKRDFLLAGLHDSRFRVYVPQGTYFIVLDYSAISSAPENEFVRELVIQHRLATIPLAAFYHDGFSQQCVRVCFAKQQETLQQAVELLCAV